MGIAPETPPETALNSAVICLFAPSITPTMFSDPTASRMFASPFTTLFCRLLKLVAMPAVPLLACSAKLAKPSPPSVSRRTRVSQKSSMVTSPLFSASYRSLLLADAPSMDLATWSSCPGMAVWMLRQSSISGLPLASAWANWVTAAS